MKVLDKFDPITLDQMSGAKLMDRIDTKFVTSMDKLQQVLELAAADYFVLITGNDRMAGYNSVYFDTPCQEMYLHHQAGKKTRTKVRTRIYLNTGGAFLEIKRKNNHGRTKKKRMGIPDESLLTPHLLEGTDDFLFEKSGYRFEDISLALSTKFNRITLVNKNTPERLTIDTDLNFHNFRTGFDASLGTAVIIELKQSGHSSSAITEILQNMRIHPLRVSKYAIGTALTDPRIKKNRFKKKIRAINKITDNAITNNIV